MAGAQQNNGNVGLFMLDTKQQLWFTTQTSPGGDWAAWCGPDWMNAPSLEVIAASQQGGSLGAQLWALTGNNMLMSTYQQSPGGTWEPWTPKWQSAPPLSGIAACQQNNGCVQLWGLDLGLNLHSITQISPGGNWNNWQP